MDLDQLTDERQLVLIQAFRRYVATDKLIEWTVDQTREFLRGIDDVEDYVAAHVGKEE